MRANLYVGLLLPTRSGLIPSPLEIAFNKSASYFAECRLLPLKRHGYPSRAFHSRLESIKPLRLLFEADGPIWPWKRSGPQLLVEAFPAAQLYQWDLPHEAYNRNIGKEKAVRRRLVRSLGARIDFGDFSGVLEHHADALDAVVCAFAANAVATEHTLSYAEDSFDTEELIAVAST